MEIAAGRMIHLGYGKYWRADEIVGLRPIEADRGPGRRTEVWVSTRSDPLVASRSERSILRDMAGAPAGVGGIEEARELLGDLLDDLAEVNPVLRRLLSREVDVDLDLWERRISAFLEGAPGSDEEQEDLFSP